MMQRTCRCKTSGRTHHDADFVERCSACNGRVTPHPLTVKDGPCRQCGAAGKERSIHDCRPVVGIDLATGPDFSAIALRGCPCAAPGVVTSGVAVPEGVRCQGCGRLFAGHPDHGPATTADALSPERRAGLEREVAKVLGGFGVDLAGGLPRHPLGMALYFGANGDLMARFAREARASGLHVEALPLRRGEARGASLLVTPAEGAATPPGRVSVRGGRWSGKTAEMHRAIGEAVADGKSVAIVGRDKTIVARPEVVERTPAHEAGPWDGAAVLERLRAVEGKAAGHLCTLAFGSGPAREAAFDAWVRAGRWVGEHVLSFGIRVSDAALAAMADALNAAGVDLEAGPRGDAAAEKASGEAISGGAKADPSPSAYQRWKAWCERDPHEAWRAIRLVGAAEACAEADRLTSDLVDSADTATDYADYALRLTRSRLALRRDEVARLERDEAALAAALAEHGRKAGGS